MTDRTNRLLIQTPEGILFSLSLAGPTTRFLAWAIDSASIFLACTLVAIALSFVPPILPSLFTAAPIIAFFLIKTGYPIVLEWFWRGQTLGKRLLRLRVVDEEGLRLRFSQVVIRNLLRAIDMLPVFYLVGGIASVINSRSQRLGDYAANTIVVHVPRITEPDLDQLLADKYNSFREQPHLCARLRQAVSPDLARIALQALLRRDELDPQARLTLFADLADYLRELVAFPEQATFGLTDEHYVRNVVDIVFRTEVSRSELSR